MIIGFQAKGLIKIELYNANIFAQLHTYIHIIYSQTSKI